MEYCIKIKEIFDVIEFKKKPSAGQINNESINKKLKKKMLIIKLKDE